MSTKLQVLCSTMYQKDFSKFDEMKIDSDVVYANQADDVWYRKIKRGEYLAEMITTQTRGLSNNRNILLTYATADICLFSDDDVVYYQGYREKIIQAFEKNHDADMIIFNMDGNSKERTIERIKKARRMMPWERNPYGSVRIAFRLKSQRKFNVWFNVLLGAGTKYGSGEDSLFINEFRKRGHVYLSTATLGMVDLSDSTWFFGYNDTYFFNQGAKVAALKMKFKWFVFLYYAMRFKSKDVAFINRILLQNDGFNEYRNI